MKIKFLLVFVMLSMSGCKKEKDHKTNLLSYLPEKVAVVIRINNLSRLKSELRNNTFIKNMDASSSYKCIYEKVRFLGNIQTDSPALLAFVPGPNDTMELLLTLPRIPDLIDPDSISNRETEAVVYQNTDMLKNTFEGGTFYSALTTDHLLIASSMELLANVVKGGGERKTDPILESLYKTSNHSKSAAIFINTANCNIVETPIQKKESVLSIADYSEWVSLDLDGSQDNLSFHGISFSRDSTQGFINLFRRTVPLESATLSLAPSTSDAILSFSLKDYTRFARNQKAFLDRSLVLDTLFNGVEEIGLIYEKDKRMIVLHTSAPESIAQFLQTNEKNSFDYHGNEIKALDQNGFLNDFFDPIISDFNANFYTVIENAFIFGSDLNAIQMMIGHYNRGETYVNTKIYESIKGSLADESNILYISNAKGIEERLAAYFTSELRSDFIKAQPSDFAFAAQVVADNNFFHTNLVVKKINEKTNDRATTRLFSIQLDGELNSDPQFVTNHRTGKKEIVVQDLNNNLYLISTGGKVLWKKKLGGKIQGKIYQVDIYKNRRLQLAFTTADQFLILDRNGKVVKPFNKTFPGVNLNPLAVFDYEGNRNYRFVVTQNTHTFMYNTKGDMVKGFKYTNASNAILDGPKHIRIGRKDYLVFKLENGELKILNREGKPRITVKERLDFSENDVVLYKDKFTLTDKNGTLFAVDEKGKVSGTKLNLNKDHGFDATNKTLVTMSDDVLSIKGRKVSLDLGVYTKPRIFYIADKIYVNVTDLQSERTYLFDSNAEPIPGFPVFGGSLADLEDMDNDSTLELVVKEKDSSLVVYKMN